MHGRMGVDRSDGGLAGRYRIPARCTAIRDLCRSVGPRVNASSGFDHPQVGSIA